MALFEHQEDRVLVGQVDAKAEAARRPLQLSRFTGDLVLREGACQKLRRKLSERLVLPFLPPLQGPEHGGIEVGRI
ncbi:MAG: hypothetical protein ACRD0G_01025 [Acidimicrobiales bacterium]